MYQAGRWGIPTLIAAAVLASALVTLGVARSVGSQVRADPSSALSGDDAADIRVGDRLLTRVDLSAADAEEFSRLDAGSGLAREFAAEYTQHLPQPPRDEVVAAAREFLRVAAESGFVGELHMMPRIQMEFFGSTPWSDLQLAVSVHPIGDGDLLEWYAGERAAGLDPAAASNGSWLGDGLAYGRDSAHGVEYEYAAEWVFIQRGGDLYQVRVASWGSVNRGVLAGIGPDVLIPLAEQTVEGLRSVGLTTDEDDFLGSEFGRRSPEAALVLFTAFTHACSESEGAAGRCRAATYSTDR